MYYYTEGYNSVGQHRAMQVSDIPMGPRRSNETGLDKAIRPKCMSHDSVYKAYLCIYLGSIQDQSLQWSS